MSINNTGKKHTNETIKKIGLSLKSSIKVNNTPRITLETISKLSLRSNGVSVKIFDKSGIFISEFATISRAAKHFYVSCKTISRIPNKGMYDNFTF